METKENIEKKHGNEELMGMTEAIRKNQRIYDEFFDLRFPNAFGPEVVDILEKYYFRAKAIGFDDEMPQRNNPERPLVYISNHSGMAFPWDGIVMCSAILKKAQYKLKDAFRPISAPMLSRSKLMNPYMVPELWKRAGSVDATFLNFETMMFYQDSNVLVYPEGVPGIGKGFNRRYQLQRFSSSFVYNCIKYKTDALSILTVNGEYIYPYSYSFTWINNMVNKIGVPFFPVGLLTPFLILCPWIFYLGFPANLTYVKGRRIKPYEMTDKSVEELSREELKVIAEECRLIVQEDLDKAVEEYRKKPFNLREHLNVLWENKHLFPYTIPVGWPLLFAEFERAYKKHEETGEPMEMKLGFLSTLRILIQNPITICFFIPIIGWIPLLIKGYWKNKI